LLEPELLEPELLEPELLEPELLEPDPESDFESEDDFALELSLLASLLAASFISRERLRVP
jgi:hypothetical protein